MDAARLAACQVRDHKGKYTVFHPVLRLSATLLRQALTAFHPDISVDPFTEISALDTFNSATSPKARQDIQTRQNALDLTLTRNSWSCNLTIGRCDPESQTQSVMK